MKPVQLGALGTGHLPPEQCSHKENPDVSARSDTAANVYYGLETPYCLHNLGREKFLMRACLGTTCQGSSPHLKKKNQLGPRRYMSLNFNQANDPSTTKSHTQNQMQEEKCTLLKLLTPAKQSLMHLHLPWTFSQVLKALISVQSLTENKNLGLFQKKFN